MGNVFTARFLLTVAGLFVLSSALSYSFLSKDNSQPSSSSYNDDINKQNNVDTVIDQALEFSLDGAYDKSFPILQHLANKNITRAKLYLAVAYYHGQGVPRDRDKAKEIFLELQQLDYETGIVNTYLSLILFTDANNPSE